MEQPDLRAFLEKAESQLAGIRGGLLLAAQSGFSARDIEIAAGRIDAIEAEAATAGLASLGGFAERLRGITDCASANSALDVVATVEAQLLQFSLHSQEFLADVDALVEDSFDQLAAAPVHVTHEKLDDDASFEVDDETLEVFQEEADGLLANITTNLQVLTSSPDDTNALWEIRRNAHTFKGAAGIVGFKEASSLAHRMEDLLDKMVELRCPADDAITSLLANAAEALRQMTSATEDRDVSLTAKLAVDLDAILASVSGEKASTRNTSVPRPSSASPPQSTPIVRVSLDRLDELIRLSHRLDGKDGLATEISQKLMQLRMVRFGTLETRLGRAVHVTCQEEDKRADLVVDGADIEIDTQILDALIEPLLHLLKNAVVHGIETAETRRLLGKPEKGRIAITATTGTGQVTIAVRDDGCGISAEKLTKKAIATGILTAESAQTLGEDAAIELIFHRGLTTAESLNMNAGRGVGMSIVRESVEARGGTLNVSTDPQRGSAFVITLPTGSAEVAQRMPASGAPLVLVVDDSSSIRRQTARFVEDAGLTAITAEDGAEALELLLNGLEPSLILSDVEMPNMNGWEFLEYVKTDDNFGHVPVVMVTSLDEEKYRQMAARLGASDYIVKPFGAEELEKVVEKFCSVAA